MGHDLLAKHASTNRKYLIQIIVSSIFRRKYTEVTKFLLKPMIAIRFAKSGGLERNKLILYNLQGQTLSTGRASEFNRINDYPKCLSHNLRKPNTLTLCDTLVHFFSFLAYTFYHSHNRPSRPCRLPKVFLPLLHSICLLPPKGATVFRFGQTTSRTAMIGLLTTPLRMASSPSIQTSVGNVESACHLQGMPPFLRSILQLPTMAL